MPAKVIVLKKYCKVCHDSGKTEAEYTSHYTRENRDPNSKVTCPILKSLECRYCCKSGHTVKYCPILKNKNYNNHNNKNNKNNKEVLKKEEKKTPLVTNKFACLDESDDETEEEKVFKITERVSTMNYAEALKSETKKVSLKMEEAVCLPIQICEEVRKEQMPRGRILDWAAYCDSDSDDE